MALLGQGFSTGQSKELLATKVGEDAHTACEEQKNLLWPL